MPQIFVDNVNKTVSVNGVACSVPSVSLPSDIVYALLSKTGDVSVQYVNNVGTTVLTNASFVTPVNQWVSAVPGLTLAAARAGKLTLASSMFAAKRQDPALVTVVVGGVSRQWDTSDGAYAQYFSASKIAESVNSAAAAAVANSAIVANNNATVANNNATNNAITASNNANINAALIVAGTRSDGGGGTIPGVAAPVTAPVALPAMSAPSAAPAMPSFTAFPYGSSVPVAVSAADMQNLAAACTSVRNALATAYNGHVAAINALGSVSAVAAYNVSAGW